MRRFFLMIIALFFLLPLTSAYAQEGQTYYVSARSAKVRTEASTASESITSLRRDTPLVILEVVTGQSVSGNRTWYRINASGVEGYIHSSLVTASPPAPAANTSTATFVVPETVRASEACPNRSATCAALTCEQAYACLNAGNRKLDRDKDGVPCESVCPGG